MGDLADGKPWISMLLSRIGSTIPTRVTFLTFGLSTNVPLTLRANQLATRIICMKRSKSWLITCVRLCNDRLLGQVGAQCNYSEDWLVEISVIAVTDANRT